MEKSKKETVLKIAALLNGYKYKDIESILYQVQDYCLNNYVLTLKDDISPEQDSQF